MPLTPIKQPSFEERADIAQAVMGKLTAELGFVPRVQFVRAAKKGNLIVIDTVAFAHFNVCRNDQVTLYEIGVLPEFQGQGYGRRIVEQIRIIGLLRKKKFMVAKCPENLPANKFYAAQGFELTHVQPGTKRSLNYWMRTL